MPAPKPATTVGRSFHPDVKRVSGLDKSEYPDLGYYWVPATADGSHAKLNLGYTDTPVSDTTPLGLRRKMIDKRYYNQFVVPSRKILISSGDLSVTGAKLDVQFKPADLFYESAGFSLYGVPDAPTKVTPRKHLRDHLRSITYVLQDSGGFQLATGVEDFIDPVFVAQAHSIYADSGVALDIPASGLYDEDLVVASARMLTANNITMREHTAPSVRLLNVCHGSSLKIRLAYLKECTKEPLDSLCVGGLRNPATSSLSEFDRGNPVVFISHILLSMLYTENKYYHYHVLGVASAWQMALLSFLAHKHQKLITSDSASHLLSGKSGSGINYGALPKSAYRFERSLTSWLPAACGCPVCSALKYENPFRVGVGDLISIHNGFALANQARLFDALSRRLKPNATPTEIGRHLMDSCFCKANFPAHFIRDFYRAVDLVANITNYKQLAAVSIASKRSAGLFAPESADVVVPQSRFVKLLRRYEKYHNKKFLR